jgi:hypothetical protein
LVQRSYSTSPDPTIHDRAPMQADWHVRRQPVLTLRLDVLAWAEAAPLVKQRGGFMRVRAGKASPWFDQAT